MWMVVLVAHGAVRVSGNFFGTAAVHRCLPPLLTTVTGWLMAILDLVTGDLHGLGPTLGIVFVLGAPVTVTGDRPGGDGPAEAALRHPAGRPPGRPPAGPTPPAPPAGLPHVPPQGNPYGRPQPSYAPGADGHPYAPGAPNPYAGHPQPPRHPQHPGGPHDG